MGRKASVRLLMAILALPLMLPTGARGAEYKLEIPAGL